MERGGPGPCVGVRYSQFDIVLCLQGCSKHHRKGGIPYSQIQGNAMEPG